MTFKEKIRQQAMEYSRGRYGPDSLNRFLQWTSILLVVLGVVTPYRWIIVLGFLGMIGVNFRMLSKNISQRRLENQKFQKIVAPIQKQLNIGKTQRKEWKTSRIVRCPHCKEALRLPKNKGKLRITCPHCKGTFEKRV